MFHRKARIGAALGFFMTLFVLWALPGPAPASQDKPGAGVVVRPARATWTTGYILEAIYSKGLEELGYEVRRFKSLSNPIFYEALVHGDVDFWANGWFPLHNEQLPKNFDEQASLVGYVVKRGALQGYLVSKKDVEKYKITCLSDFTRQEVKDAFDANGDGKADLVACPPGWGCEKVINHHMQVYNLEDHFNLIKANYSAGMAEAVIRYKSGEPIVFYTWTPNWTVNRLKPGKDVMWINVPEIIPTPGQKGLEEDMVASGIQGAVTDPIKMGFVANDIRVAANNKFLKKNPAARRFFEVMQIPLADIADQNARYFAGEDDQEDVERHANEWIKANQKFWDHCLEEARAAAQD
jgi:glycine betaine/proline transport system substrate-binding protein